MAEAVVVEGETPVAEDEEVGDEAEITTIREETATNPKCVSSTASISPRGLARMVTIANFAMSSEFTVLWMSRRQPRATTITTTTAITTITTTNPASARWPSGKTKVPSKSLPGLKMGFGDFGTRQMVSLSRNTSKT